MQENGVNLTINNFQMATGNETMSVDEFRLFVGRSKKRMKYHYKKIGKSPPKTILRPKFLNPPDDNTVFIPYNVPSKKRAYIPVIKKKIVNGFPRHTSGMVKAKHIVRYENITREFFMKYREWFIEKTADMRPPLVVQLKFVRQSVATRWDYNNLSAIITDLMVTHGWVTDDNIDSLVTIPPLDGGKMYLNSQEAPGVFITVLRIPAIHN
jgi:hypothetical protein